MFVVNFYNLTFALYILRYDYLEFTDSRGGKVRYDMKVGTEKWPKVRYEGQVII